MSDQLRVALGRTAPPRSPSAPVVTWDTLPLVFERSGVYCGGENNVGNGERARVWSLTPEVADAQELCSGVFHLDRRAYARAAVGCRVVD